MFSFSTENWQRPRGRGRRPDGDVRRADRPRDAGARRRGRADALHRPPRRASRAELVERMDWAEADDRRQRADHAVRRLQLRRPGGDRRRGARLRRGDRGRVPRQPLRARDARPRPPDPHQRRAADLELPALAVRLLRARLPRRALARLRPRGVRGRAGRVRARASGASEVADVEGSRPFDSELDFDHPRRSRPAAPPPPEPRARRRRGRRDREPPRAERSETLARIAWALPWIAIVVTIVDRRRGAVRRGDDRLRLRRAGRVLPDDRATRGRSLPVALRGRRRRWSSPPTTAPVPDRDRARRRRSR